jgi:porin
VAVTEVTFTQYLVEKLALFGGLLNTAEGDENELAGSALSASHFLNSALLYSLVEDATVPNAALGGGVLFEPNENISGSFSVFGTQETAGEDPFEHTTGTTFATEWTVGYQLLKRPGAQTFGLLYGIDASRTAIATDPRLVLGSILSGQPIPNTSADTWAFYYNGHQYVCGDSEGGWGVFARFGISDGDPNPVKLNLAGGLGGKGLLPQRRQDTWGVGVFYLDMSNEDLLKGLNVGDETGGELFYNIALTPWLHVTLDAQVIDSALPHSDTAWVFGVRTHLNF